MRHLEAFLVFVCLAVLQSFAMGEVPAYPSEVRAVAIEAWGLFNTGKFEEAEVVYRKLVAQLPGNIRALDDHGVVLFRLGKLEEAKKQLLEAVALAPDDGYGLRVLGILYLHSGEIRGSDGGAEAGACE